MSLNQQLELYGVYLWNTCCLFVVMLRCQSWARLLSLLSVAGCALVEAQELCWRAEVSKCGYDLWLRNFHRITGWFRFTGMSGGHRIQPALFNLGLVVQDHLKKQKYGPWEASFISCGFHLEKEKSGVRVLFEYFSSLSIIRKHVRGTKYRDLNLIFIFLKELSFIPFLFAYKFEASRCVQSIFQAKI